MKPYGFQQSGAEEACWAHNPEVGGSKPLSAMNNPFWQLNLTLSKFCYLVFLIGSTTDSSVGRAEDCR